MPTLSTTTRLRRLTSCEPRRPGTRPALSGYTGGDQLQLELPIVLSPGVAGRWQADPLGPSLAPGQLRALLAAILEVRDGRRPPTQLQGRLHPRLYRRLLGCSRVPGTRYTLKTVRACRPSARAVEACGTVHSASRALAVVARFEWSQHGWRCTFFELLMPRHSPR